MLNALSIIFRSHPKSFQLPAPASKSDTGTIRFASIRFGRLVNLEAPLPNTESRFFPRIDNQPVLIGDLGAFTLGVAR
jgi:hypothetical protein